MIIAMCLYTGRSKLLRNFTTTQSLTIVYNSFWLLFIVTGPRNAKGISSYASARVPSAFVNKIESSSDFQSFVDGEPKKKAVLFTDKNDVTLLFKSLSTRYQHDVAFAQVHSSVSDITKEFKIDNYPTILIFKVRW